MANTYYVGSGGSDSNSGLSWVLRKLTIQSAVTAATGQDDEVVVAPGTYREVVTMNASGASGHPIKLTGDYSGTRTSGTKGEVRITGSNNDQTATRGNCIVGAGVSFVIVSGFRMDGCTGSTLTFSNSGSNNFSDITVKSCVAYQAGSNNAAFAFTQSVAGKTVSNVLIDSCIVLGAQGSGITFSLATETDALSLTVRRCLITGTGGNGVISLSGGGFTVLNCTFVSCQGNAAELRSTGTAKGVINNSVFHCCSVLANAAIRCNNSGNFTEDYNNIYGSPAARSNVAVGTHSTSNITSFDSRLFFEMLNSGNIDSVLDLASYSALVETNSGAGNAPATDLRGKSKIGSFQEWGALEYDSTLKIAGGGGMVSISPEASL